MSGQVVDFIGTSRDDRSLLTCDCGCAQFKIVKRGASSRPIVECSNCECTMKGVIVDV